jgi:hypothetical protein
MGLFQGVISRWSDGTCVIQCVLKLQVHNQVPIHLATSLALPFIADNGRITLCFRLCFVIVFNLCSTISHAGNSKRTVSLQIHGRHQDVHTISYFQLLHPGAKKWTDLFHTTWCPQKMMAACKVAGTSRVFQGNKKIRTCIQRKLNFDGPTVYQPITQSAFISVSFVVFLSMFVTFEPRVQVVMDIVV